MLRRSLRYIEKEKVSSFSTCLKIGAASVGGLYPQPRRRVAPRCSGGPQGIDNLRALAIDGSSPAAAAARRIRRRCRESDVARRPDPRSIG